MVICFFLFLFFFIEPQKQTGLTHFHGSANKSTTWRLRWFDFGFLFASSADLSAFGRIIDDNNRSSSSIADTCTRPERVQPKLTILPDPLWVYVHGTVRYFKWNSIFCACFGMTDMVFLDICICCVYSLYFMVHMSVSGFSGGLRT